MFAYATTAWANALRGAGKAEDITKAVASRAIEEFALDVSKSYGLPFREIIKARDDVLNRLTTEPLATTCKGVCAKTGTTCTAPALCGAYCTAHRIQGEVILAKKRRLEAFSHELKAKKKARDGIAEHFGDGHVLVPVRKYIVFD